jgi:RNAse (barnase) inhibitor barstar
MFNQELKNILCDMYQLNPTYTYVVLIDGNKSKDLNLFMKEVSIAFKFPDYYSGNMNSFNEIINDLSWLNANDYILAISESNNFLKSESEIEQEAIKTRLVELSKEWNNVPNYQGEDKYRQKSRFIIHFV